MEFRHVMVNGRILRSEKALMPLSSPALMGSFGVYESVEVVEGVAFCLHEHLLRLAESARMIDLGLHRDMDEVAGWAEQLLSATGERSYLLRIIAWGAAQPGGEPTLAMLPVPTPQYPEECYQFGGRVITFEGSRFMPTCKSMNTLASYLARREAHRAGVPEAILSSNGELTEGARSNLFVVYRGELSTPPADCALRGITRDIVIRLASLAGYSFSERRVVRGEVSRLDECFITSTSMHILPVVQIDETPIGTGRIGPVTRDLMARFEVHHRACLDSRRT
jgi:branched-subunit amino acid aminotransferase/4-amino-4-deoxychorismate lyase